MKPLSLTKLFGLVLLINFITGCAVQKAPPSSFSFEETFDPSQNAKVNIVMGSGSLNVFAGKDNRVVATIQNNTTNWQPALERSGEALSITQGDISGIVKLPSAGEINDWSIQLSNTPTDLFIEGTGYYGNLNLSNTNLSTLRILDSRSDTTIIYEQPNPTPLDLIEIGSAGSTFEFIGIANANFDQMNFRGVGGNYTLNFSGALQRDAQAAIIAGLGTMQVLIPKDLAASVTVSGNPSRFEVKGPWKTEKNVYRNDVPGEKLLLDIKMDLGALVLILE
jgi:hypothetical protein